MDLAGHRTDVFSRLKNEFETFLKFFGFAEISVIPVSKKKGDMVVRRGSNMPWFEGYTLLQTLASKRIRKISRLDLGFWFSGWSGLNSDSKMICMDTLRGLSRVAFLWPMSSSFCHFCWLD